MKPGARVLLVDEDPAAIEALHASLTALGCVVSMAHDGAQALVAARRDRPDVAVLEVALPEASGYQVCRELKRLDQAPVVVMLTARAEPEVRFWATECGADAFLARPVEPDALLRAVEGLLDGR